MIPIGNYYEAPVSVPCTRNAILNPGSHPSILEKVLIKLLLLSNYNKHRFWMDGFSDYLAVSYRFQQCTLNTSEIIRMENKTHSTSVI
jgi:hypothetical protein